MKSIALIDGVRIAYKEWGNKNSPKKVLSLHGWLDNCNSFNLLGPRLADSGFHCVALDHAGHGWSSHLSIDANYSTAKSVSYVREVLQNFGWEKFDLVGHSMGAGVSVVYSGAFPETVRHLVLIEGIGPVAKEPKSAAKYLRHAVEAQFKYLQKSEKGKTPSRLYSNLAEAVNARVKSVTTYPGEQSLSVEAATMLVSRGTYKACTNDTDQDGRAIYEDTCHESSEPLRFRHDPRLVLPSHMYHSDEHVLSYLTNITAKTMLILAENGWPPGPYGDYDTRVKTLSEKGLFKLVTLPGSHHLHLDPHTAPAVADEITKFLTEANDKSNNDEVDNAATVGAIREEDSLPLPS